MSLKATRIVKQTPQSQQLATFVASLGIPGELELYNCAGNVYVNAEMISPILSVDMTWFVKNAEIPLHYIILNKKKYINRYGMTKLLGQSKQPAALKLQDYLYEIFYRIETEGVVHRDSVVSRKQLLQLTDQIDTYKSIIETNQVALEEAQNAEKLAQIDYYTVEQENKKLKKQLDEVESNLKEATDDLDTFRSIANKLAKYVRIKSNNAPSEAYSDMLDVEDEISDLTVVRDAIDAKNKLKKESKGRPKISGNPAPPVQKTSVTKKYYLQRSTLEVLQGEYHWTLVDTEQTDEYLSASADYLLEDICDFPYNTICYRILYLTNERKNMIVLFLEMNNHVYNETTILKLIEC